MRSHCHVHTVYTVLKYIFLNNTLKLKGFLKFMKMEQFFSLADTIDVLADLGRGLGEDCSKDGHGQGHQPVHVLRAGGLVGVLATEGVALEEGDDVGDGGGVSDDAPDGGEATGALVAGPVAELAAHDLAAHGGALEEHGVHGAGNVGPRGADAGLTGRRVLSLEGGSEGDQFGDSPRGRCFPGGSQSAPGWTRPRSASR